MTCGKSFGTGPRESANDRNFCSCYLCCRSSGLRETRRFSGPLNASANTLARRLPLISRQLIPLQDSAARSAVATELTEVIIMLLDGVFVSRQIDAGERSVEQLGATVTRTLRASLNEMIRGSGGNDPW